MPTQDEMEEGEDLFVREVAQRLYEVADWGDALSGNHAEAFTRRIEDRVARRPAPDGRQAAVRAHAAFLAATLRKQVQRHTRQQTGDGEDH